MSIAIGNVSAQEQKVGLTASTSEFGLYALQNAYQIKWTVYRYSNNLIQFFCSKEINI